MTRGQALECALLTLVVATLATVVPLVSGITTLSWDLLNHHVYLGFTAWSPRWTLDVLPASFQSYQHPTLYWPVWLLLKYAPSGAVAGAVWGASQAALLVPPLWLLSYRLLQPSPLQPAWLPAVERVVACVLGLTSVVVWVGLETTANDLLAAVPLLWALAAASHPNADDSNRPVFVAALLLGLAIAAKLSNVVFAPLALLWWWRGAGIQFPLRRGLAVAGGVIFGFVAAWGPFGWQLWRLTGNPFYPFFGHLF